MPRQRNGNRVLGPYPYRGKFRIFLCETGGEKVGRIYATEKEALRVKAALEAELSAPQEKTVEEALDAYLVYLQDVKHNKPGSCKTTLTRLRTFFGDADLPLGQLTPKYCGRCYESLTERISARTGRTPAVDSHRNVLAEARTFLNWCVKPQKWLKHNPLGEVAGRGRRQHGKPQLRIDEARRLRLVCHAKAAEGDDGAVAVLVAMLMGLRAGEIVSRTVRDLDDGGCILWVDDNDSMAFSPKTEAGRRPVPVWDEVRPYLLDCVRGKTQASLIFRTEMGGPHWRDWVRKQTRRLCTAAKVPVVCAHSLRGFAATLGLLSGVPLSQVAASLGHESSTTTLQSYAARGIKATLASQQAQAILGPIPAPGPTL